MRNEFGQYDFSIFSNPVFLAGLSSWFLAQLLKVVIALFDKKHRSPSYYIYLFFWSTGGMPSSHSALVTAVAVSVGYMEGFASNIFIAVLCFALLTVRDAVGVRRSAGLQARALNLLGGELREKCSISFKPVKEVNGHTVTESLMGMVLGFFIATAFCSL